MERIFRFTAPLCRCTIGYIGEAVMTKGEVFWMNAKRAKKFQGNLRWNDIAKEGYFQHAKINIKEMPNFSATSSLSDNELLLSK